MFHSYLVIRVNMMGNGPSKDSYGILIMTNETAITLGVDHDICTMD